MFVRALLGWWGELGGGGEVLDLGRTGAGGGQPLFFWDWVLV